MGCPYTHDLVRNQLCGIYYYPGLTRNCKYEITCNKLFQRWLKTEPEVQRLHREFLAKDGDGNG